MKEILEVEEYKILLRTPCLNLEVQLAFILSCYTGLRWVDVKNLKWQNIKGNTLVTRIIQKKTGQPVMLTLHPIAKAVLENKKLQIEEAGMDTENCFVFRLPSQDGCYKVLNQWISKTNINKHITWSCAAYVTAIH